MSLFTVLPNEDVTLLAEYIDTYAYGTRKINMEHFLRFWSINKEKLYKVFGNNLVLKKEICVQKSRDDLERDMIRNVTYSKSQIIQLFQDEFYNKLAAIREYGLCSNLARNVDTLINNEYTGPSVIIPKENTVNNSSLQIPTGCKPVKMIGKIAKALGVVVKGNVCSSCGRFGDSSETVCRYCGGKVEEKDGYEEFRRAHSLVLNQKKLKGNLCLSLHPLDFLTMSDNHCGWGSCMSWIDNGDYRIGTIEMMNSPCVLVAYLEAEQNMRIFDHQEWNNKRWRQLYIVTPELILGNRQYPYVNDDLQGAAIKWIRELCNKTVGWGPFDEETCQIYNREYNVIKNKRIYFCLNTDHMYNDVYDNRLAYVSSEKFEEGIADYHLNFSGEAICCNCGRVIEDWEEVEIGSVSCSNCDGRWRCYECGEWHYSEDDSYVVDGEVYCECCYDGLATCPICGEKSTNMKTVFIQIADSKNPWITGRFNNLYNIEVCLDCCKDYESKPVLNYGKLYATSHTYTRRHYFDLKSITDEGLEDTAYSWRTIEFLKKLRDADGDEERVKLIHEYGL